MTNLPPDPLLVDFGERRLISDVLGPRYADVSHWGDDAAFLTKVASRNAWLVATTDPCPPPMSATLGFDDWFYTGWLLATINLSDLAAAGATPVGLLSSLILPAETRLSDFNRLLDGLDECCSAAGTRVVGGNLKESPELSLSGTAVGICGQPPLSRRGAGVGDRLGLVGTLGSFWAGVLGVRHGLISKDATEPLLKNVLTPPPKTEAMSAVASRGLVKAAIDTSDGLYPALAQLGGASGVGVLLNELLRYAPGADEIASELGLEPLRLALGWGDWQIVIAYAQEDEAAIRVATGTVGFVELGEVVGEPGVWVRQSAGEARELFPLESERFTRDSWFSAGLEGYVSALTDGPLFKA